MDRASRSELVKTIDGLKDQLQQYKAKLRDVVSAYKSLVKEKEALEASLSALSDPSSSSSSSTSTSTTNTTTTTTTIAAKDDSSESPAPPEGAEHADSSHTHTEADPLGVTPPTAEDMSALKERLKTLTVSLTTLSQEKSKMESQFVKDNKMLRQEVEELQQQVEKERHETVSLRAAYDHHIQELKGRVRSQQLEREKEQTDHVVMLRELQKLMADERSQKESLEMQLDDARRSLAEASSQSAVSHQYEQQVRELSEEVSSLRQRLHQAEVKATQPSSFVLDLQKELASIKTEHQRAVQQEREKACEAESRLQQQSRVSEEQMSSLEDKLSELSNVVGNYERLRFHDQQVIQKLKERLSQLDVENTALVQAAGTFGGVDSVDDGCTDPQELYQRMVQLKTRLLTANQASDTPVDIAGLFQGSAQDSECSVCQQHRAELEQVKEEFERYKLRAQSVLKNKHKDSGGKEVDSLKEQVGELRERLKTSALQHQDEVEAMQTKLDGLSRSLLAQADAHKAEVAHLKNAHQKEVFVLELEARKQRERTVALLAEKDAEIDQFRSSSGTSHKVDQDLLQKLADLRLEGAQRDTDGLLRGEADTEDAVSQLLMHPAAQGEASLLHFAQEKARQDVEIVGLRKTKHQLETALRELQHAAMLKEERAHDALQELHDQIHKLERDKSREGANLEYLKNVFLKFLTSYDFHGRCQMLRAITTILQFSPTEKESVRATTHLKF